MGGVDPFTTLVVSVPVGQLEEPLFLEALYRIETAAALAWTLGLSDTLPPVSEGADFDRLSGIFPLEGAPSAAIPGARKRAPGR